MKKELQEDLMDNFDQNNIDNIQKQIENGTKIPAMVGMFVDESGTGESLRITEKSRKISAKELIN